jgi:hypothetical protein
MSVETSLAYQQQFFTAFAKAWSDKSDYRLYKGIDDTARTLRLDIHEVPGYVLAYDKSAQEELHHYLRKNLISWLREYIPFFEVADDGRVFFGDWYHRREFGRLDVFAREIMHQDEDQRAILPHLQEFAADPDHYLDVQVEQLRKACYQHATDLHSQLETLEADNADPDTTRQNAPAASGSTTTRLRGLLKNFMDPDADTSDDAKEEAPATPTRHAYHGVDINRVRAQFQEAKEAADAEFDAKKRSLQVAAAVTRYEYQAVLTTYSSIDQFINILSNLPKDYTQALKKAEEDASRA